MRLHLPHPAKAKLLFINLFVYFGFSVSSIAKTPELVPLENSPESSTIIVWMQGDANHRVLENLDSKTFVDADEVEIKRVRESAQRCQRCNVVLLHDPSGSASSTLEIFIQGKRSYSTRYGELNSADPNTLAWLLNSATQWFPRSSLHYVYRGHNFTPRFIPGNSDNIPPFDYKNDVGTPTAYGIPEFVEGFRRANLPSRLTTVTLAACRMAYLNLAAELAPYARTFIASSVDILETADSGFDYTWMESIAETPTMAKAADLIQSRLMIRQKNADPEDSRSEYPVVQLNLSRAKELQENVKDFLREIRKQKNLRERLDSESFRAETATRTFISDDLYAIFIKKHGGKKANFYGQTFVTPSPLGTDLDLGILLNAFPELGDKGPTILKNLGSQIKLVGKSKFSPNLGLAVEIVKPQSSK